MKKIPTIYKRDPSSPSRLLEEINPACQWVFNGEGKATRKWDGTAVLIRDGKIYQRYDCKKGRTPPPFFEAADTPDEITGHWPGWIPVSEGPDGKYFREALENWREAFTAPPNDGTYELIGPKVNGNPEHLTRHEFIGHGLAPVYPPTVLTLKNLSDYFGAVDYEGIVWHHPDGRMAKIKGRDFGIKRN